MENTGCRGTGVLGCAENTGSLFSLVRTEKTSRFCIFLSLGIFGIIFALGGNYCRHLKVKTHGAFAYIYHLGTFPKIFMYISIVM